MCRTEEEKGRAGEKSSECTPPRSPPIPTLAFIAEPGGKLAIYITEGDHDPLFPPSPPSPETPALHTPHLFYVGLRIERRMLSMLGKHSY